MLYDLTPIFNADPGWKNLFVDDLLKEGSLNGKIYRVPIQNVTTAVHYYNKSLLKNMGVEYPKTWEAYKDYIRKARQNGFVPIGVGNKANWPIGSCYFGTLSNRVTGTDWYRNIVDRKGAKFTDPDLRPQP